MQLILPIASLVRNRCDRSYLLHRHKLLSHPIPSQCNNDHLFHQICKIDAIVATYCIRFVFDSRRSDAIGLKISRLWEAVRGKGFHAMQGGSEIMGVRLGFVHIGTLGLEQAFDTSAPRLSLLVLSNEYFGRVRPSII